MKENLEFIQNVGVKPVSVIPTPGKAEEWGKKILKQSDEFADEFGLGACGPVADNLVDELQTQGRKARVMFHEFGNEEMSRFAHYVAVELDEADNVIRIWDPTNPFARMPAMNVNKDWDVKTALKEYFGEGSEFEIFKKAGRSVDDNVFDKEMVDWWKDKIRK